MKTTLIVCSIAAVLTLVTGCSKKRHNEALVLNYEDMIHLDAEDSGEGSIASTYQRDIVPALKQYVAIPAEVVENLNADASSYTVTSQGKTYAIFLPDMKLDEGQHWGNATFALFDIVNKQLQNSAYQFYAINGGNDLGGMFLTKETYDQAVKSLKRKEDWPYLPLPESPWYGQPHN